MGSEKHLSIKKNTCQSRKAPVNQEKHFYAVLAGIRT